MALSLGAVAAGVRNGRPCGARQRPSAQHNHCGTVPAVANLADESDGSKIKITIDDHAAAGYDPNWLRNAMQEPLDEASIDGMEMA